MPDILSPYGVPPVVYPNMLDSVSKSSVTKPGTTPDWKRADGSQKGMGFLGPLKFHDGRTSTEVSVGVQIGGKEIEIPALVPTLTPSEIDYILKGGSLKKDAGPVANEIVRKAQQHAEERLAAGKSPFAGEGDAQAAPSPATPQ